ncbi:hypothetical protein [Paenibacillus terrae]|nr:hypothetical protein [Paenibacillus terrae]
MILPDELRPTQRQYDELKRMSEDALTKATASQKILNEITAVIGEHDGSLVDAVLRLVQDKAELLQTIERHTDEQLNSEKLLQRIRELETIANGRSEMLKSFAFKLIPYVSENDTDPNTALDRILSELEDRRIAQQPVPLPQDVVDALDSLKSSRHNAAQIIRLALDGNNAPQESQSLYQFVSTRTGLNELIYALVYGYTAVAEQDEAAAMLESVTTLVQKWYHSPATDNGVEVLSQQICDFIRERETAAGKAVTI